MTKVTFPPAIFVTGTDTGIGKTVVSAMITLGLKGGYWKPVQSGNQSVTDTQWVKFITAFSDQHFFPETYLLSQPISPHAAAKIDQIKMQLKSIVVPDYHHLNHLIVEGAGGIMVPINEQQLMIDLMEQLGFPVLLVCRSTLGTINHTLLSLLALRQRNIPVLGIVMNGPRNESNRKAVEHYGQIPVISEIEPIKTITRATLEQAFISSFDQ